MFNQLHAKFAFCIAYLPQYPHPFSSSALRVCRDWQGGCKDAQAVSADAVRERRMRRTSRAMFRQGTKKTGPMTECHQAGVDMKRRTSSVPVQDIFLLSAAGYSLRSIFTMPPLASLNTTLTVEFLLNILLVSISVVPNWAIITSLSSMVPFLV